MGCLNSKMASSVELDPKVTPDGVQLAALTEETLTQHDAQVYICMYDPSTQRLEILAGHRRRTDIYYVVLPPCS